MSDYTAIIGSGNLAYHLARVLPGPVVLVTRNPDTNDDWPAKTIGYDHLTNYKLSAIFLAVPDTQISDTSKRLSTLVAATTPVFHTSGATPVTDISDHFVHRGVMWPIRSLRKGEAVTDWKDLPLVIYATSDTARSLIESIAHSLSDSVTYLDDRQRAQLHLAAVFSNNFVTALYEVSFRLCKQHGIPFELLLPILRATAGSQDGNSPALRQTGAAARGDRITMDRHLANLDDDTYRALYKSMSDLIFKHGLTQHDAHLGRDPDLDL